MACLQLHDQLHGPTPPGEMPTSTSLYHFQCQPPDKSLHLQKNSAHVTFLSPS